MNISIKVIPHKEQRYPTPGDWFYTTDGGLDIRVSALGNWRYEFLIGVHELVEVLICRHEGVSQEAVDAFDMRFEAQRIAGKKSKDAEPGDDPEAPYHKAHTIATQVERLVAAALGVNWDAYGQAVLALEARE